MSWNNSVLASKAKVLMYSNNLLSAVCLLELRGKMPGKAGSYIRIVFAFCSKRIRFISYLFCRCLSIKEELTCIFVVSKNEFSEKNEVRIVIEELGVSRVMFVFGHAGSNLCDIEMRKML